MFLTLEQYLSHFPPITITKEQFVKKFVVTYSTNPTLSDLFSFRSVIKNEFDPRYIARDQIIDYFYDIIITNRYKYLTEFYKSYFELPNPYGLKWDNYPIDTQLPVDFNQHTFIDAWIHYQENTSDDSQILREFTQLIDQPQSGLSLQKNDMSRKIIRNLNYLDILDQTKIINTCKSNVSFWQTLINVYNHLKLEDRFFAPSSIGLFLRDKGNGCVNFNNFFYLFQQYQPKASIFNPYTINWMFKNVFTGTKLFTPVLSWVSYLCAFMHSDWEHYVGVDVIQRVCDRCQFLFDYYQHTLKPTLTSRQEIDRLNRKHLDLYCRPSESLLYDQQFLSKYDEYFDAIILCPPYFNMEIYQGGQQSIESYPDYQQWLTNYWEDTVLMCYLVLKRGRRFGFIINNYVSLKKESYPLIQDLNMIALKYFKLVDIFQLLNRVSPLRMNKKKRTEMLFVYEKI